MVRTSRLRMWAPSAASSSSTRTPPSGLQPTTTLPQTLRPQPTTAREQPGNSQGALPPSHQRGAVWLRALRAAPPRGPFKSATSLRPSVSSLFLVGGVALGLSCFPDSLGCHWALSRRAVRWAAAVGRYNVAPLCLFFVAVWFCRGRGHRGWAQFYQIDRCIERRNEEEEREAEER